MMGDYDEHFAYSRQDARASRQSTRSGRARSPTSHSDHGSLIRHSILRMSEEKRAKKVRFYRNGDRFFKGMIYAVSPERFRTFESLMAELTLSPLCDKVVLPNGVRHMFTMDGSKKITSLCELQEGESYVCASTDVFKNLEYTTSSSPNWNYNVKSRGADSQDGGASVANEKYENENKGFILKPKLVTIIRNGSKPRKAVRILLNKKTAHSFDQVLTDITEAIKLDSGAVRKIFTLDGRQVCCLADFFSDETIFVAYGHEKLSVDDFDLDDNEVKMVGAYKSMNFQPQRITLRSPKFPRRSSSSRSLNNVNSDLGLQWQQSTSMYLPGMTSPRSATSSPKSPRKVRSAATPKHRMTNGNSMSNGTNGHDRDSPDVPNSLLERYDIGKVIGEGNFAVVKECLDRFNNRRFALKIIDKARCKGKEQMIENEVSILRKVKHPNIIILVEEFDTSAELYLVMELVSGGDLFDAISSATKYTERDASGMVYNLASALKYLHSLGIVHRDIKPENLLVCDHPDGSKSLKLGDFGLATTVTDILYAVCGTPTYVAPEIIAESGYGLKVDVWSAGVITYILLCGFPPFVGQSNNQDDLFDQIMMGKFEFTSPFWDELSTSSKELISHMLTVDPEQRYTAEEVLAHPWVADDTAKDEDLHDNIAKGLSAHFVRKSKQTVAGVRVITTTALDKGSRFFQGRGGAPLTLHPRGSETADDDEVF
ncbi:serine/threonine-protein kinase DCLK1-like isoform X2 [Haliotis asinina]|uniref:serine/threonine-protein kinase DCLK1-like isoform X2 n=1 Tax=Haliotis asinina TaxID=109174 RepID=UPI0035317F7F